MSGAGRQENVEVRTSGSTRPKLPALEPPDGPRVVPRRLGNHLGRDPLQGRDEILKGRVVVLQLSLGLRHEPRLVFLQIVTFLADVPLWCLGFEVPLERVRSQLLATLERGWNTRYR